MFEIRPGRDSDKSQILELIKHVFGDEQAERADRRWQWQWRDDPRLVEPGYKGVVAEWDGLVIGNLSSIPCGLYIEGQPVEAYWFADALVHWGHLRRALRERKRSGQTGWPDLSNGIAAAMLNHPAAGSMQLGKHVADAMAAVAYKIGCVDSRSSGSWARLISFRQPLERAVGKPLGSVLGWFADVGVPKIPKPKLEVATLEGLFDSRFDELWALSKAEHPAITRRDRAVLNWRYRQHPDTVYSVLTVEEKGGLRGYLVYSIFHRHLQRRAYIVDALVLPGHSDALDALIAAALMQMRRQSVHKVESFAGASLLSRALERSGFRPRLHNGKVQPVIIRRVPEVELYVTRGDGDGG